MKIVIEPKS